MFKSTIATTISILAVAFCAAALSTTILAQEPQAKCPPTSRCLTFQGEDSYITNVEITDGASEILERYNIKLENNGTKLVWLTPKCRTNTKRCASVDLTGRHPTEVVPHHNLNKTVKMTAIGREDIKIFYQEFDDDEGVYWIRRGVWSKN